MPIDPRKVPFDEAAGSDSAVEAEAPRLRNTIDPEPIEWDAAVRAASILLEGQFGPPGSSEHPAITDMACDLAARLCAYDEIVRVVGQQNMLGAVSPPRP